MPMTVTPLGEPPKEGAEDKRLTEAHQWKGPGPMPAKWRADDGTIVYRSYADYCND